MKTKMVKKMIVAMLVVVTFFGTSAKAESGYVSGDFHQHSTYSDGSYTIGYMMDKSNQFGLDWWANSEHGGSFSRWATVTGADLGTEVLWSEAGIAKQGKANGENMWRWQSLRDWSFRDVKLYRQVFPTKTLIQGYEWNVPGHEHANLCIINNQFDVNPNCEPLAKFEYIFDNNDQDDSNPNGWVKTTNTGKVKTLEAITWLQTNYPTTSWAIPTHPERANAFKIEDFRNFNNAGPDVCFGFDSQPGHQKSSNRGGLRSTSYGATTEGATWGGTGAFAAKIGGVWDALLSEGRNWWLFANSDCHYINDDFFPGEYQRTKTFVTEKNNPQAIVDGLRSGNSYIVTGDLIDSLSFTIGDKTMGQTYTTIGDNVHVEIIIRDPQGNNFNTFSSFTNPELDHIDLIAGSVSSMIDPSSPEYTVGNVTTTSVIARFGKTAHTDSKGIQTQLWTDLGNGFKKISVDLPLSGNMYFRLRGTHHAFGVEGTQIDTEGNPLVDLFGENTAQKAFEDLWFYSNPIFVNKTTATEMKSQAIAKINVVTNQSNNSIEIKSDKPLNSLVSIFDLSGKCVVASSLKNESNKQISMNGLSQGIYTVSLADFTQKIVVD